jgi:hypothetical protein
MAKAVFPSQVRGFCAGFKFQEEAVLFLALGRLQLSSSTKFEGKKIVNT